MTTTAPTTAVYRVVYAIDLEAKSPQDAAEQLAGLLSQPGVPGRGSYDVTNERTNEKTTIDLGEQKGEW